jgi:hypothetical protein
MMALLDVMPIGDVSATCCVGAFVLLLATAVIGVILRGLRQERALSRELEAWARRRGLTREPTSLAGGDRFGGIVQGMRVLVASADVLRAGNSSPISEISIHAYGTPHARAIVLGPCVSPDERELADGLTPISLAAFAPPSQLALHASSERAPAWLDARAIVELSTYLKLVGTWNDEVEVRLADRIQPSDVLDRALALALAIAQAPSDRTDAK